MTDYEALCERLEGDGVGARIEAAAAIRELRVELERTEYQRVNLYDDLLDLRADVERLTRLVTDYQSAIERGTPLYDTVAENERLQARLAEAELTRKHELAYVIDTCAAVVKLAWGDARGEIRDLKAWATSRSSVDAARAADSAGEKP